ncbi:MAG: DUF6443 domain-containing protein, partial [Bacteroidia bacterium]
MKNYILYLRFSLVILTLSLLGSSLQAKDIYAKTDSWSGSAIQLGIPTVMRLTDPDRNNTNHVDAWEKSTITLRLAKSIHVKDDIEIIVDADIIRRDNAGNALPVINQVFTVTYNKDAGTKYQEKNSYSFSDCYDFDIDVKSFSYKMNGVTTPSSLPSWCIIEAKIEAERYLQFDRSTAVSVSQIVVNQSQGAGDITIAWNDIVEAENYQLEWLFVDDVLKTYSANVSTAYFTPCSGSGNNLTYDFTTGANRIVQTGTSFKLPYVFPHGYLIYRVRALGVDIDHIEQQQEGVWNIPETGTVCGLTQNLHVHHVTNPHLEAANWQLQMTFAEDGKYKAGVTYADGSLRARQSSGLIKSDDQSIVSGTIYDRLGRPVIQTLPTPTGDNVLKYRPNYIQNGSGNAYTWQDFDPDGPACGAETNPMGTGSGPSRYYSDDNPDKAGAQAYVPDANGYPFTQVEYTSDNTGRVHRQAGPGDTHKMGAGHETRMLYGAARQPLLDRLFGTEVGYDTLYKRHVTVDPNGQASVVYLDRRGNTIATALDGILPANLDALDSHQSSGMITMPLIGSDRSELQVRDRCVSMVTSEAVAGPREYTFRYEITGADVEACDNVCFDCVYDLEISIVKADCGTVIYEDSRTLGSLAGLDYECNEDVVYEMPALVFELETGQYTITRSLCVNEEARQTYADLYLENCAIPLEDFITDALAQVDYSGCDKDYCDV